MSGLAGARAARHALGIAVGLVLGLGLATATLATYDRAHAGELLPGTTVGGVDVGGRAAPEALALVEQRVAHHRARTLDVGAGANRARLTLAELGLTSDAAE
ncbi:MAG: hypothetical protein ACRD0M_11775, partial [Acidimicrobiales bacterium]